MCMFDYCYSTKKWCRRPSVGGEQEWRIRPQGPHCKAKLKTKSLCHLFLYEMLDAICLNVWWNTMLVLTFTAVLLPAPAAPVRNINNWSCPPLAFNCSINLLVFSVFDPFRVWPRYFPNVVLASHPPFINPNRKVQLMIWSCNKDPFKIE